LGRKKVEIGGEAHHHGLTEVERDQRIQAPCFPLRIKYDGHRQWDKPKREQKIVGPGQSDRYNQVVIDTDRLRNEPQPVSRRGEPPEGSRQAFAATAGLHGGVN
jgi:hypothetical protein